jgi:CubicO group peptidase (beta-lactamase class C family)
MRPVVLELSAWAGMAIAGIMAAVTARAADPQAQARMQQVEMQLRPSLPQRMAQLHVPGLSVAVVHNDRIDWAKGYGVAWVGGPAVTTETLFQASSISKPVTALGVLHLVEAGKINLDHQANEYLKDWKIPDSPFTANSKVTVAELLNHTAGIHLEGFPGYSPGEPIPTLAQMLRGEPPAFGPPITVGSVPGTEFRYAGGGYVVLRKILTDVTGQPFDRLMHDTVLMPLGMAHSTFEQPLSTELAAVAALPHDTGGRTFKGGARIYPEQAPDGLWTTASDLGNYILAMQRSLKGTGFLSKDLALRMFTAGKEHWGLGPIIGKDPRHPYFLFSGGNYGFISVFVAYENGDGVVVLTNGEKGGDLAPEVVRTVAGVYGWPDFQPVRRHAAVLPAGSLEGLAGIYRDSNGSMVAVTRKKDALFQNRIGGQGGPQRLYAQSRDRFVFDTQVMQNYPETAEMDVTFARTADGRGHTLKEVLDGATVLVAATRLDPAEEQAFLRRLRHIDLRYSKQMAAPGGAQALRQVIAEVVAGTPDKVHVGPDIAEVLRIDRIPNTRIFSAMGAITSVSYRGTAPSGYDTYRVLFEKGDCVFHILVDEHGVIQNLDVRID